MHLQFPDQRTTGIPYLAGSYDAGVFAADAIKSSIDAENLDPSGKIALFMSVINTSGEEMFQGLYDRLSEVLPTAEVLEIQYNENDIDKGIGQIEATLPPTETKYPESLPETTPPAQLLPVLFLKEVLVIA